VGLDTANVIAIIIGALVSILSGVGTFVITRTQSQSEIRRIRIEEQRAKTDEQMVGTSAAAQLVGSATSAVGMFRDYADKLEAEKQLLRDEITNLKAELAQCQAEKSIEQQDGEAGVISQSRLNDLSEMIVRTLGTRICPFNNEVCAASNAAIIEYAKMFKKPDATPDQSVAEGG
jgi:hypothetical protein